MQSQMHLPASEYNVYRYSLLDHHDYIVRSNNPSPVDHGELIIQIRLIYSISEFLLPIRE